MKKNNKILYVILATVCPMIIGYTTFYLFSTNKKIELKKIEKQKEQENVNENNFKFVVKEIDGKIGVFENGKNKALIKTLEREVEYLPDYDKKILKDGIYVETPQELNKVLEDYED